MAPAQKEEGQEKGETDTDIEGGSGKKGDGIG